MDGPPSKRLRNADPHVHISYDDPFEDDEDFTQEDLDEIDIIASQATTVAAPPRAGWDATNQRRGKSRMSISKGAAGKGEQFTSHTDDAFILLEAQHAKLKKKLKEVEEEILLKSGEIRVLRDSLRAAQQEKEADRQTHLLQEQENQRQQSEKEKELHKKVQSLQSELQFKEAEVNELKTKLHSSDRGGKTSSLRSTHSPRVPGSPALLHHGSSGSSSTSSPAGSGFPTKDSFNAQPPSRTTETKMGRAAKDDQPVSNRHEGHEDPFRSVTLQRVPHRGGILLAFLLQQPLSPSKLGLSHLLSIPPSQVHSTSDATEGNLSSTLGPLQKMAVSGLSMLTQCQNQTRTQTQIGSPVLSTTDRWGPGAVLLLPLLDFYLSQLCQSLSSSSSPTHSPSSAHQGSADTGRAEEVGRSGLSPWDTGLASLRVLKLLVTHSDQVVEAVLSEESQSTAKPNQAAAVPHSQHALLQHVLQLCDVGVRSPQRDELSWCAATVLCVLLERTPHTHTERLCPVLRSQLLCVSADSRWQCVWWCVSVLRSLSDHELLLQQLCAQHDPCLLLKLFQYIRSRSDNHATHSQWAQLDLEVIRLLSRLTQRAGSWSNGPPQSCPCYTELVQTVVVVLHRHWLDLGGSQGVTDYDLAPPSPSSSSPPHATRCRRPLVAALVRESVLLLHWLLMHHGSFTESCRPLLHVYDQVIPAVRETLKRLRDLSESEELALEDLCRCEGDDMDLDSVS